jgi:hypothetical protein
MDMTVVRWDGNTSKHGIPYIVALWDVDGFHTYAAPSHCAAKSFAMTHSCSSIVTRAFVYKALDPYSPTPDILMNVYPEVDPRGYLAPEHDKDTAMRAVLSNCTTKILFRTDAQETKAE